MINSLTPWGCDNNFKIIIFNLIIQNSTLGTFCKIAVRWVPLYLTDENWTLKKVMAWCQCWPGSMAYDITRPRWVNIPSNVCDIYCCIIVTSHEHHGVWNHQQLHSLVRLTINKTSKPGIICPLGVETTFDQWLPLTKGQWYGKCFHVMISSCDQHINILYIWEVTSLWSQQFYVMHSHKGERALCHVNLNYDGL